MSCLPREVHNGENVSDNLAAVNAYQESLY